MRTVLIAEDDPHLRMLYELAFDLPPSWAVRTFGSGEELLRELTDVVPALIVLDMLMPGMNGVTAYQRLRELPGLRDVPVLFVTAVAADVTKAGLEGPHVVLSKPASLKTLLAVAGDLTGKGL